MDGLAPADCTTAADVDALARALFGRGFLPPRGVLHVTATWARAEAEDLVTLRINDATPKSAHDFFALNLARASADAVVVTGQVLRDEPRLQYRLLGPGTLPDALAAWRVERAQKTAPPTLLVLTSGRDLDLDHPALHGWAKPLLFVPRDAPLDDDAAAARGIEVARAADVDVRAAVARLRARRAETLSIEAGPNTARALYDAPVVVDELWLSTLETDAIPAAARGPALTSLAELEEALGAPVGEGVRAEPSGRWRFRRYRRARARNAGESR